MEGEQIIALLTQMQGAEESAQSSYFQAVIALCERALTVRALRNYATIRFRRTTRGRAFDMEISITTRHFQGMRLHTLPVSSHIVAHVQSTSHVCALAYVERVFQCELACRREGNTSTIVVWERPRAELPRDYVVVIEVGERRAAVRFTMGGHARSTIKEIQL